jgi:DNA-binding SARP family transcriptional activator/tetratricopeptide (TPR) repeat protein
VLRVLGPLEVVAEGRFCKIGGPREHVVLAMLALRANHVVSVDQLIDAVWGEEPPTTARGQIQTSISALRKLLGDAGLPDAIDTRPSGYHLTVGEHDLDSAQFSAQVATAHRQAAQGQVDAAVTTLRGALDLWRGPALAGIGADLVRNAAAVLDEARLAAAEERIRLALKLGRHVEITGELRILLSEHPWRERLYGFLMLAQYRAGRQAEALEVYRQARTVLTTEVGIEPGQELRDLERAVLSGDPVLDLPADEDAEDERQQATIPRQLPSSIGDFVGREEQLAQIKGFLLDQDTHSTHYAVPIVAISGRGGVGKSTLALRIAHEVGEKFPDGHIYLDLSGPGGEENASTLLGRLLRALGVGGAVIPERLAERMDLYRSRLSGKRLLLVLDDVTNEAQVLPLLPGSASCAVIVTSRRCLAGLPGAHWVHVGTFDRDRSRRLLATIVGEERLMAEPDAAAEVIRYCGGLPLALRIAGARLASRPHWRIGQLSHRLRNEVRRLDELSHHGLEIRSSIGLTYRSLGEQAKRLFRLFGVIAAPDFPGWTAAALLDCDLFEAEEVLDRLVEAQMLDVVRSPTGQVRYRFHDLIRVYAQELLAQTETEAVRSTVLRRLLGAWLALAEMAHRKEYGGDYTILHGTAPRLYLEEWASEDPVDNPMDWLENERVALVSAIRQAAAADLDELCWDLALTLVSLFEVRGYIDDWRETAELARKTAVRAGNRAGIAAMLYSHGSLCLFQKQFDEAEVSFADALAIYEADENVHGQALVLRSAARVDRMLGNVESMLSRYDEALHKMRAVGDLIGQASILTGLAAFHIDEGALDTAEALLSEALVLCETTNYRRGEAHVMSRFADLYRRTGRIPLSRRALDKVLRTVRETGDRMGEAYALYGIGVVRRSEGRLESAEATLAHAVAIADRIGDRMISAQSRYTLGEIALARMDFAVATGHLDAARTMFVQLGSSVWLARTHILMSEVHDCAGETELAALALQEAEDLLCAVDSKQSAQLLGQLRDMRSALSAGEVGQRG